MIISIDDRSTVPPYDQVRQQIETMVISGVLPTGATLPSIRQLAADLQLAPATVARAYAELENAGIIETRRGRGSTVAGLGASTSKRQAAADLRAAAEAFAQKAKQLGVSRVAAIEAATVSLSSLTEE